jgi:hypothetical protein
LTVLDQGAAVEVVELRVAGIRFDLLAEQVERLLDLVVLEQGGGGRDRVCGLAPPGQEGEREDGDGDDRSESSAALSAPLGPHGKLTIVVPGQFLLDLLEKSPVDYLADPRERAENV